MRVSDIPNIDALSTTEKIELVEELWDTIAADEGALPVLQSHKDELEKRLRRYESQPENLLTFEELQEKIRSKK